ncbi:MAG: hypothetical protein ACREO3_08440 [Arenimonas sp.]
MPFTPLHLGPGAVFKAIGGRHFSFMVFGGAQVLMDLQPLAAMLGADVELHGISHTLAGAAVIGAIAFATGKPVSDFVLRRTGIAHQPLTWTAAATGAWIGTSSHIALDALMHPDLRPLWPLSDANPLLYAVDYVPLHGACLVLGAVGGGVVAWRWRRTREARAAAAE